MSLSPGTNLGSYKILSLLGSGGMGEVYCALDSKLARRVAVKVLPDSVSENPDSMARFEREARALAALQHPGIVAIYDFGREGDCIYTVTELLEGKTLREKLDRGPLPPSQALQIAWELAEALAAAHDRGIVHRDLKPGNIFILRDGRMKLLDFGLAKQVSLPEIASAVKDHSTQPIQTGGDTEPGLLMGTAGYMSPEQVRGETVDARTDLFAFGCLLFEVCTGRTLFKRESLVETLHAILVEEPSLQDPLLPPHLEEVVRRCLEKDPQRRFQSALDLAHVLRALQLFDREQAQRQAPLLRARWSIPALALSTAIVGVAATRALWTPPVPLPTFLPMTRQRGDVYAARFTPDGRRVLFSARWGAEPPRLYTAARGSTSSLTLLNETASLFAVSHQGELAIAQSLRQSPGRTDRLVGRLARMHPGGSAAGVVAESICAADWDPEGKALAVVRHVDGRDRLEYPVGTLLTDSVGWISHLRFAPDGRQLVYLDHPRAGDEGGAVVLTELGTGQRKILSEGWTDLRGLAWHPAKHEVWFTAGRDGGTRALYAVSLGGRLRPILAAPQDLTLQDIATTGEVLLCQSTRTEGILGKAPEEAPRLVEPHHLTRTIDLSRDGQWMLCTESEAPSERDRAFYLQNLHTGQGRPVGQGRHGALSPDGSQILVGRFEAGRWRMTIQDLAGSMRALPFDGFVSLHRVAWHPDGQSLLACGTVDGEAPRIWRLGLDQARPQAVSPEGVDPERPFRVSPDGRWLVAPLGAVVYRIDLQNPDIPLQPLPAVDPPERILGYEDPDHLLLMSEQTLPAQVTSYDIPSGKRRPALVIPALGHEGALLDRAFQAAVGGRAYAGSYLEVQSGLFCVEGLK